MNQQRGFSLTEVLVSLMLVSTMALTLIQQQFQTKQLLNQIILRAGASQFLDQIDESLFVNLNKLPEAPLPYLFNIKHSRTRSLIRLDWSKAWLIRTHGQTRTLK